MRSGNLQNAGESTAHEGANDQLRVCHIASGDLWAGAEVQIATLLKFLAKDPRLAVSAVILNRGKLADDIASHGISLRIVPESEMGLSAIIHNTANFVAAEKVEIIHSHRYKENLVAARAAKRARIAHLVRTQHGMPEPRRGARAIKQGVIDLLDRAIARRVTDKVISVSQEMSQQLARSFQKTKIVTIYNGIDAATVCSKLSRQEAKLRLGISANCPVVGTAGRLEPVKRIDLFLRAAAVIGSDVHFVIAGTGRESATLAAFAKKLNLTDRVHFLGHRDDIHDVLCAFDVLLLTSDHEGLPMIVLEAMALGVPIVSRAVGGIPEVIEHGKNGLLVLTDDPRHLADACLSILAVPAVAEGLVERGKESVRAKFSAATNAARVAELYLSLLQRK